MNVQAIFPRGYCKGVVRAIEIAKEASTLQQPIYILGMIVHNKFIVDALEDMGVKTIDKKGATRTELLDHIDQGTIIITAHGASEDVFTKAKEKGLSVIDASCQDVIRTHELIKQELNQNRDILYIGKSGHPEAEGALGINQNRIHLITSTKDIDQLDPSLSYTMTNQTTMSLYDVYDLCEYAKETLHDVKIAKETCTATKIRQEAIQKIDEDVDLVIIVGDPHSNNTKKLASISNDKFNTIMIESIDDLDLELLMPIQKVAITSGASTPTYLTNQIIEFLEAFDPNDPSTHMKPIIDKTLILK